MASRLKTLIAKQNRPHSGGFVSAAELLKIPGMKATTPVAERRGLKNYHFFVHPSGHVEAFRKSDEKPHAFWAPGKGWVLIPKGHKY